MARKVIKGVNGFISLLLGLILSLMLIFSGYAFLDTYQVVNKASVSAEIMHYQPTVDKQIEENPSLLELLAINSDVIAWLTLDNTSVNYPILQARDNAFYLTRDFYKKYSVAGSVFLDYQNGSGFEDLYSVFYGHNMSGGMMFASLLKYGDENFFEQNQTGYLFLPTKTFTLEIFAYLHVDAYETPMFTMVYNTKDYVARLDYIEEAATYYRDIGITERQQIIALSTCSSAINNDRSIVVARIVEQKTAGGAKVTP